MAVNTAEGRLRNETQHNLLYTLSGIQGGQDAHPTRIDNNYFNSGSNMANELNQPREFDAVLGGHSPPPVEGAILGGIEGVKQRLVSPLVKSRLAAVGEAMNYADEGLALVIAALQDESVQVHRCAYKLLQYRIEPNVKQALREYKSWDLVERLREKSNIYNSVTRFANRKVKEFNPQIGITETTGTAYVLEDNDFDTFLQDPQASKVEALIFRWGTTFDNTLAAAKNHLKSLKAVFTGPYDTNEYQISWISPINISPVMSAYPNLEVLQVRGCGLEVSPSRHNKLKAIIVESGGLIRETIAQICALELPALNHLELWLGRPDYGGDSSVDDLMPIFYRSLFPKLAYLGLCNSEYSDEIAEAVADSPEIEFLKVLDLSMGTLSDKGAEVLLNCPMVKRLDILNVSENYLSDEMIERLQQLDMQVISNNQKRSNEDYRYCSVAE